jgi:hypothetical protein
MMMITRVILTMNIYIPVWNRWKGPLITFFTKIYRNNWTNV